MHGVYHVLATTNVVVSLFVLLVISMVPIQVLRNHLEGMQYQIAWSADFGGAAQAFVMAIGIGILQREPALPLWAGNAFQMTAGVVSLAIGVVWLKVDWDTQWADRYHHLVVAPLQVFLMVILLPVIAMMGTTHEIRLVLCLLALVCFLFIVDIVQGRLNQRRWLREEHGFLLRSRGEWTRVEGLLRGDE